MRGGNDPCLSLETSHSHSLPSHSFPCPLPQSPRKQSQIQRLVCETSFWAVIPAKKIEEPGRLDREGGQGNVSRCHCATEHSCRQLGFNPSRTFWGVSICNQNSLSLKDEETSLYAPIPSHFQTINFQLSRVATQSVNFLALPVLCMPEWWVDFWAESRERCGRWGKVVSGYTCIKLVTTSIPLVNVAEKI